MPKDDLDVVFSDEKEQSSHEEMETSVRFFKIKNWFKEFIDFIWQRVFQRMWQEQRT